MTSNPPDRKPNPRDRQAATPSGPGTGDTTEYAPSKAPETREHAEDRADDSVADRRLLPGSPRGTHADVGMSGLDRDTVPNRATSPGQTDFGSADDTSRID